MQINRLFEIVYILLNKKAVTAKELSKHFEVSVRTIYRDVDILSEAGIPVFTNKGKGGGIRLTDNFILNKSILSDREQNEILMSLQSLNATKFSPAEPLLDKLSILFNKQGESWIDIDFSGWGSDESQMEKFNIIKSAIINKNVIAFHYFSSYGDKTDRTAEPVKLLFKGQSWYLYGFCRSRHAFRLFKVTRIKNIKKLNESFERIIPQDPWSNLKPSGDIFVNLVLKIDEAMSYRVYDEFDEEHINKNEDGSLTVTAAFPENEWVYGYILSYGSSAEVLEPEHIRKIIKTKFQEGLNKYL